MAIRRPLLSNTSTWFNPTKLAWPQFSNMRIVRAADFFLSFFSMAASYSLGSVRSTFSGASRLFVIPGGLVNDAGWPVLGSSFLSWCIMIVTTESSLLVQVSLMSLLAPPSSISSSMMLARCRVFCIADRTGLVTWRFCKGGSGSSCWSMSGLELLRPSTITSLLISTLSISPFYMRSRMTSSWARCPYYSFSMRCSRT